MALIDWDEAHVDVPDLDLALPYNVAGLDEAAYDTAAQALAAREAAVCWDDEDAIKSGSLKFERSEQRRQRN